MKKIIVCLLALAMVFSLAACGSNGGSGDGDKVYELNLSMHDPDTTAQAVFFKEWADQVSEATDGHVKINIVGGATLSAATDIADNVKGGAVDIGWLYTSYFAGQFPLSDVINLPMQGFGDPVVSTKVLWDLYDKYEQIQEEWSDFELLFLYGNPGMIMCSATDPITDLASLDGKVMRCPAGAITDVVQAWGASPLTMAPPDMHEALEKKNINSYIFEPSGITNFSLQEVTKYYTDYALYDGPFGLIVNKEVWNSLPEEYQTAIKELSGREGSIKAAQVFADDANAARDVITAAGGEFVELDPSAIAEMQVAADEYAASWAASVQGVDGADYLATAKSLAEQYAAE